MKPARDLILVEADEVEKQTKTGILLAGEKQETRPPTGTVKEIGPLVTTVKKGDRILFERFGSIMLEDNMRICEEAHLIGVLDES